MVYRRTEQTQARRAAQRERIVAAATMQLAEHGYAGLSVAAVAERAGVATGTVYNHVPGKTELVAEVFRAVVAREVAAVEASVEAVRGDTRAEVTAFVETFARRALRSRRLAYALLAEPVDPAIDALRLEFRLAFRRVAADVINRAIAGGTVPDQDSEVVAAALVGAVGEALVRPLLARARPGTVPTLTRFALRSIGVLDAVHA